MTIFPTGILPPNPNSNKKTRTALIYASPSPVSFPINTILNLILTSKRWGYDLDMSTLILIYLQTGSRAIGGLAQTHAF